MLFEGIVDSVLRRHGIAQRTNEEKGRVILQRLHELLDDAQQGQASFSDNFSHHNPRDESPTLSGTKP